MTIYNNIVMTESATYSALVVKSNVDTRGYKFLYTPLGTPLTCFTRPKHQRERYSHTTLLLRFTM